MSAAVASSAPQVEIAKLESFSISLIAAKTMSRPEYLHRNDLWTLGRAKSAENRN